MFGISMWELVLIGVVLFLVVGPAKLPGLAKSIGQGVRDLRRSLNDIKGTVDKDDEFVKAVKEARQSVVEAREAVRSMFDEGSEPGVTPPEEEADPAPRPVPRGRPLVRHPPRGSGREPAVGGEASGPSLGEGTAQASFSESSPVVTLPGGGEAGEVAGDVEPLEAEVHRAAAVDPAPAESGASGPSRGPRGRRLVRPGRSRPTGGGSPTGSG